jgi:hypothetical protein
MSRRQALLVALTAFGLFLVTVGGDSLKIGHVEYFPMLSPARVTSFVYHAISIGVLIFGLALILLSAELCRRADARASATLPGIRRVPSFVPVLLPAALISFLTWAILDTCLTP